MTPEREREEFEKWWNEYPTERLGSDRLMALFKIAEAAWLARAALDAGVESTFDTDAIERCITIAESSGYVKDSELAIAQLDKLELAANKEPK